MSLKNKKPNPLNFLGIRKVHFPAPYFFYITIPKYNPMQFKKIDDWIFKNLNGRYYIGRDLIIDSNKTVTYATKIGFEQEKESSFFLISYSNL